MSQVIQQELLVSQICLTNNIAHEIDESGEETDITAYSPKSLISLSGLGVSVELSFYEHVPAALDDRWELTLKRKARIEGAS